MRRMHGRVAALGKCGVSDLKQRVHMKPQKQIELLSVA